MTISEYVEQTLKELATGNSKEGFEGSWVDVHFDIGVNPDKTGVVVQENSDNRVKFTLRIKRV